MKRILAITEGFIEPRRVLIAFDGGMVTRRGVEMVAPVRSFVACLCTS